MPTWSITRVTIHCSTPGVPAAWPARNCSGCTVLPRVRPYPGGGPATPPPTPATTTRPRITERPSKSFLRASSESSAGVVCSSGRSVKSMTSGGRMPRKGRRSIFTTMSLVSSESVEALSLESCLRRLHCNQPDFVHESECFSRNALTFDIVSKASAIMGTVVILLVASCPL